MDNILGFVYLNRRYYIEFFTYHSEGWFHVES